MIDYKATLTNYELLVHLTFLIDEVKLVDDSQGTTFAKQCIRNRTGLDEVPREVDRDTLLGLIDDIDTVAVDMGIDTKFFELI